MSSWAKAGNALEEDGFTFLNKTVVKLDKHKCTEGVFQIRGRISGNSLNVPCASVHPEGQLKQKGAVTLRNRCQLLEQGRQRTAKWFKAENNDARQGTSNGWCRVAFSMGECTVFLKPCSITLGSSPCWTKWALVLLCSCSAIQRRRNCNIHSPQAASVRCIGRSVAQVAEYAAPSTVQWGAVISVSWGRAGPCGKAWGSFNSFSSWSFLSPVRSEVMMTFHWI